MDFETNKIDALLISNFYNILYLTGFSPLSPSEREGWVFVTKKKIYLFTDGRYFNQIKNRTSVETRLISHENRLINQINEIIAKEHIETIGFERDDLKYGEYVFFKKRISLKFIPTTDLIIKKRQFKTRDELRLIKKACAYTDQCLKEIVKTIHIGETEKHIALRIENWLQEKGLEMAFPPIVAVDKNTSYIHYSPSQQRVKKNSIILIDIGAKYNNYCADITRMFFTGKPSTHYIQTYNHLLHAQILSVENIQKYKKLKNLDLQCRTICKTYNMPEFSHSLGHGVGLEVHESPHVSFLSKESILPGQVITIEPGTYIPGKFGMRIEDTVYIGENNIPEVLTKFSKEMMVLP